MDYSNLRREIAEFLDVSRPPKTVSYKVMQEEIKEGYTQQLISYLGSEGDTIRAYLLIPNGKGPFPAALVHHQHKNERHLGKSEPVGIKGDPLVAFGPSLAKTGFVVLAPDSICFEDRRRTRAGTDPADDDWLQHFNEMCYRLVRGLTLMKKVLDDAMIAGSVLASLSMVDKSRLGLLGHSYGGQTTLFQGAVDERFRYACTSGAVCSYADKMSRETGIEMAAVIPGFLQRFEVGDLLRCFLPRKLLVVSATEDKHSKDADVVCEAVNKCYQNAGIGSHFTHKRFVGGHGMTEERHRFIVDWMARNCQGVS